MTFRAMAILAAAAWLCAAAEVEDRTRKSIPVQPGGRLTLDAEWGSIEVQPADTRAIEVEVYRKVDAPTREESEKILKDFELEVSQSGNDVFLRGVFKTGWRPESEVRGSRRRHCRDGQCLAYAEYLRTHQYKVLAPREFNTDLTTRGGSITVGDLKGEVRGKTSGGALHFGRIDGPIWGRTSGGSVTLSGSTGPADLHTSGGSIRVGEVTGEVSARTSGGSIHIERATGRVAAKTSGGNIEVKESSGVIEASTSGGSVRAALLAQLKAPCRLTTSGGNIVVYLGASVGVDLDASASSGRVAVDFPVTVRGTLNPRQLKAPLNGGGPALYLRTSGGGIQIRKAS